MNVHGHSAALAAAALLAVAGCTGGGQGLSFSRDGAPPPPLPSLAVPRETGALPSDIPAGSRDGPRSTAGDKAVDGARLAGEGVMLRAARSASRIGTGRAAASADVRPAPGGSDRPRDPAPVAPAPPTPAAATAAATVAERSDVRAAPTEAPAGEDRTHGAGRAAGSGPAGSGPARGEPAAGAGPAGALAEDGARSGGAGVWVLGLLVAGGMAALGWLALQPPWRRWRWWGRLKRRLARLRARGSETRSVTTTSMITMTTRTPPWLSPLRGAGGKEGARTPVAGTDAAASSSDAGETSSEGRSKASKRRRRKRITNATLPVIPVPRDRK